MIIIKHTCTLKTHIKVKMITWDEVLLDIDEVYENYTLVSTNHLQEFISFNEPYIESVTGHYACARQSKPRQ